MGCLEEDIDYALSEVRRKTRVYVASSWRNEYQPWIVTRLRTLGLDVYDFRGDGDGWSKGTGKEGGFSWSQISASWTNWNAVEYIDALCTPIAQAGFDRDMNALKRCDICLFVMPCGPSASMEMGWACGAGRKVIAYIPKMREPDLMVKMADYLSSVWFECEHLILELDKKRRLVRTS